MVLSGKTKFRTGGIAGVMLLLTAIAVLPLAGVIRADDKSDKKSFDERLRRLEQIVEKLLSSNPKELARERELEKGLDRKKKETIVEFRDFDKDAFADDDGGDKRRIQGKWKVTEMFHNGQVAPRKIVDIAGYVIADGRLYATLNGKKRKDTTVSFKLNDTTNPKQIDLTEKDSGETNLGIYELKGNQLKICFYKSKTMRPKTFQSKSNGPSNSLIVLERTK